MFLTDQLESVEEYILYIYKLVLYVSFLQLGKENPEFPNTSGIANVCFLWGMLEQLKELLISESYFCYFLFCQIQLLLCQL